MKLKLKCMNPICEDITELDVKKMHVDFVFDCAACGGNNYIVIIPEDEQKKIEIGQLIIQEKSNQIYAKKKRKEKK